MQTSFTTPTQERGRAFLCDPVCAQPFGHNVVGLKYFSDAVRPYFSEVYALVSRLLPAKICQEYGFIGEFDFYYHRQIDLGQQRLRPRGHFVDAELRAARQDFAELFKKYRPNKCDAVIFPSVDYYGAIGAFAVLEGIAPQEAPSVYLRFIGVMENATSNGIPGLKSMLRQILKLKSAGYPIYPCAETPRYADYLALEIGTPVGVVPYPPHGAADESSDELKANSTYINENEKQNCPFIVNCPGSARIDKGYLSLHEIFSKVRVRDTELRIRFITQGLPINEAIQHSQYTNQLYAIPGVRLLPSVLAEEEINSLYSQSDLVILPYDKLIYKYRGSAVFMESLTRGIPVVALEGSGFCDQILYYGAGAVVSTIEDMVTEIFRYSEKRPRDTRVQMTQARHRYNIDALNSLINWIVS